MSIKGDFTPKLSKTFKKGYDRKMFVQDLLAGVIVLLVTFFLKVLFDLTAAIEVGVLIACLLCMKRMAETVPRCVSSACARCRS